MPLESVNVLVQQTPPLEPLPGVKVTLFSFSTGALYGTAVTGTDGIASFVHTVVPGDVGVKLESPTHNSLIAEPYITVPFTNGVTTYGASVEMQDLGITPARSVKRCHLHGVMVDASGWATDSQVIVEVLGKGQAGFVRPSSPGIGDAIDPSSILTSGYKVQVPVNLQNGYWGIDLPVGALVQLMIPSIRLCQRFRVPDSPKLHVKDIRPWLLASSSGALIDR